jgi:CubicO group peptidase (beta-lactamase class C family)
MKRLSFIILLVFLAGSSCRKEKPGEVHSDIHAIENGLLPAIRVAGDSLVTYTLLERMEHYHVPGVSIAVVENGQIQWARAYGTDHGRESKSMDTATLFQAGSISKPVAALAALKLVEKGKIGLDEDVNKYLQDWKVPENPFTTGQKVTIRGLLTHTAGMNVHGFPGYRQTDTLPTTQEVLEGKGNTPAITVDTLPGSIWRYSGGGYTVMQKVVEDITGQPFETYLLETILRPLGMANSTYAQPLDPAKYTNISPAYDAEGKAIEGLWHNYPEKAAAGLWTTPADLARYCLEMQRILAGKTNGVLKKETIEMMLTKHKNDWGLGPALQGEKDSLIFRHGGKNAGFTNEMVAFAHKGKAVVVMTNADNGGKLIGEVLRAISHHYNWGISPQRVVETVPLPVEFLQGFLGRYKLDFQVPGVGDYYIELDIHDGHLRVKDPNNGEINNLLTAVAPSGYLDLESGDEAALNMEGDTPVLLLNDRYRFEKVIQ